MPNYRLIVMTNPVEGREQEFNDWYSKQHLSDICKLDHFISAQRFKVAFPEGGPHKYCAIYNVEAPSAEAAMGSLMAGIPNMFISDAFDMASQSSVMVEELGPVVSG